MNNTVIRNPQFFQWTRNVRDHYKTLSTEEIRQDLKAKAFPAATLICNVEGDLNISSVMRSANSFNLSRVFYYGRKRWDKRGSVGVYNYSEIVHLPTFEEVKALKSHYRFVALENNTERQSTTLPTYKWDPKSLIVVGEECNGIPPKLLELCDDLIEIPSFGSVRSLNLASAASIAFYDYTSKKSNEP